MEKYAAAAKHTFGDFLRKCREGEENEKRRSITLFAKYMAEFDQKEIEKAKKKCQDTEMQKELLARQIKKMATMLDEQITSADAFFHGMVKIDNADKISIERYWERIEKIKGVLEPMAKGEPIRDADFQLLTREIAELRWTKVYTYFKSFPAPFNFNSYKIPLKGAGSETGLGSGSAGGG